MDRTKWPTASAAWHDGTKATVTRRPRLRGVLSVLPVLGLMLILLLLLVASIRPACRTLFVPLWLGGPSGGLLPAVAWADRDLEALCTAGFHRCLPVPTDRLPDRAEVIEILRGVSGQGSDTTIVVYIAGPACRDHQGRIHLLPTGSDLDDPATWLPLRQILTLLRQAPHRHKLLVLDIAHAAHAPPTALWTANVLAELPSELAAVPDPSRLVLTSCAAEQVSQSSEVLGRSVFGYYFERGLTGDADGVRGFRDGQVTVGELADYARDRVSHWAMRTRLTAQEPTLWGDARDFPLVAPRRDRSPSPSSPPSREYPSWLLAAWQSWYADSTPEKARLGRLLQTTERAWRDGAAAEPLQQGLASRHEAAPKEAAPPPLSLARHHLPPVDQSLVERLARLEVELDVARRQQPAEQAVATQTALTAEFLKAVNQRPLPEVAQAIMARAYCLREPNPNALALLVELLEKLEPEPQYVETITLRRIATASVSEPGLPPQTVRGLLRLLQVGELVAARSRSSLWVHARREEAARARHAAELLLLSPDGIARGQGMQQLEEGLSQYAAVQRCQEEVEAAQSALDDARCRLLDLLPYLNQTGLHDDDWGSVMDAALSLDSHLRQKCRDPERGDSLRDLPTVTRGLRTKLDQLARPFTREEVERSLLAVRGQGTGAGTWRTLDALLAVPQLDGSQRKEIWDALQTLEYRLQKEVDRIPVGTLLVRSSPALGKMFPAIPPDPLIAGYRQLQLARLHGAEPEVAARLQQALDAAKNDDQRRWEAAAALWENWDRLPVPPPEHGERDLWQWLADWYRYQFQESDPNSPTGRFFGRAVDAYQSWLTRGETYVALVPAAFPHAIEPDQTADLQFVVQVAGNGAKTEPLQLSILTPDQAQLELAPAQWRMEPSAYTAGPVTQSCAIRLGREAMAGPLPRGILLRAQLGGRAHHARVELPFRVAGPEILVCQAADSPAAALGEIPLRAVRGTQTFAVWLRNPSGHDWSQLAVEVLAGNQLLGSSTTALAAGETRRVTLAPTPADATPATPLDTPPGGNASPQAAVRPQEIVSPLSVRVRDLDAGGDELTRQLVPLTVLLPDAYVVLERADFESSFTGPSALARLQVLLRPHRVAGPPFSTAELLWDEHQNGLSLARDGTPRGQFGSRSAPLRLYAHDMVLRNPNQKTLQFRIRVDDWPRAFTLRVAPSAPSASSSPQRDQQPSVYLNLPPCMPASANLSMPLQVDNPPAGAQVEVDVGRLVEGAFVPEATAWRGLPWAQRLEVQIQEGTGNLGFSAAVEDPVAVFDLTAVRGRRQVRARLLDAGGAVLASAMQSIMVSDAPPNTPQFVEPPTRAWRAAPLPLVARGSDPLTPVQEVVFFVGQPANGHRPENVAVVTASPRNTDHTLWAGELPLPPDKLGPLPVTVQVTNGLGLSTFNTITVMLEEQDPQASQAGEIRGRVVEGDRPQAGLEVLLSNAQGTPVGKTLTGADGRFLLSGVAPGSYRLTCAKSSNQRRGTFPRGEKELFVIRPGESVAADIVLYLP